MKRAKLNLIGSVSASVLLVSSLLVACATADITIPQADGAPASSTQVESASESRPDSSAQTSGTSESRSDSNAPTSNTSESAASQSRSQSSRPSDSSSRPSAAQSSQAPPASSSQAPSVQAQAPPPQAPTQQPANPAPPPAPPPPEPPPAASEPPPPPPTPSVNIDACLSAAAGWAAGNNMAVNDGLYLGGAGYENPIDTNGKTDAQVTEHLLYQLGLIHVQLVAMPEFDPGVSYPCYMFVVDGTLIYVLYG